MTDATSKPRVDAVQHQTMTASEIERAMQRLRSAQRELATRDIEATWDSVCQLFETWRKPDSPVRRALETDLAKQSGFAGPMIREGLDLALEGWTAEALRALIEAELASSVAENDANGMPLVRGFALTNVVLAGSIPMPSLLASLAPLLLGSAVAVKPASRDLVTPRLIARSLAEIDPLLGRCLEVLPFASTDDRAARAFASADCVTATGSDESLDEIARHVGVRRRFVPYGHRTSIAAIGPDALDVDALHDCAEALAIDTALWDQLGCLSPIAIHVVEGDHVGGGAALARELAGELAKLEERWPRGPIDAASAARVAGERSEAEMRAALGRRVELHASADTRWTVVLEDDAELRPAPLHRFVRVIPHATHEALFESVAPLSPILAGVAIAGFGAHESRVAHALMGLGASRICAAGQLQAPPLDWPRDNRAVLLPMARLARWDTPASRRPQ